jgi:dipeptidyl-peptidase 4
MMAYPNRSHAISEGTNTTLHLRELMTRYLTQNLSPGPRSNAPRSETNASEK